MSEAQIVKRQMDASLEGDKDAFGEIVKRYQALVCSITYSMTGDIALSEDLAQETFVTAWQRLRFLRDPSRLKAWLCGIARNTARMALRKRVRDPLHRAAPLTETPASSPDAAPLAEGQDDRDGMVWAALADVPEAYREVLVLFYRQGKSVRAVAEGLGIAEECVRQRLSRGRKMLRERVAGLVEQTLESTAPDSTFPMAVVAVLPAMSAQGVAMGVLSGGAAAGKGSGVLGKGLAAGAATGMLGGLVGAVAGMTGGFFGMWASIRNAQTLRLRRYWLKCSALMYAFVWVFLAYEGVCGVFLWRKPVWMGVACGAGWLAYLPALLVLIVSMNTRGQRIYEEDTGKRPAPDEPLQDCFLSLRSVWYAFAGYFMLAVLGSAGVILWLGSLPHVSPWLGVGIALFSHYGFASLFRKGVRISQDEVIFAETAHPAVEHLVMGREVPTRRRYWNGLCALGGCILGPSAWLIVMPAVVGEPGIAAVVALVCAATLGIAARFLAKVPGQWRWIFFWALLFIGAFDGLVIAFKGADWMVPEVAAHVGLPMARFLENLPRMGGAIYFGLYLVFAVASLYIPQMRPARDEEAGSR